MADVLLASPPDALTGAEVVAIKRIRPELVSDPSFMRMFLDEAEITRRLNHPNIACLLDWGEDEGVPYLVMEFVAGVSVKQMLSRGGLPPHLAAEIGAGVARALDAAHEQSGPDGQPLGIVHRDVTPHNVMVTFDGQVKLLDFGIALARVRAERTRTGVLKGKWSYMSPEQVAGDALDRRSDIFTLGSLLYEMLTGEHAFEEEIPAKTLMAIINDEPAPLSERAPGLSPELITIVGTCLRKVRSERYPRAIEVAEALEIERRRLIDTSPAMAKESLESFLGRFFAHRQMQIDKALYALEEGFQTDGPDDRDSITLVQEAPFLELSADMEPGPEEPAPESWTGQHDAKDLTPTPSMRPDQLPRAPRDLPETVEIQRSSPSFSTGFLIALVVILGLVFGLGAALAVWLVFSASS